MKPGSNLLFILFSVSLLLGTGSNLYSQLKNQKGIKYGIEVKNYLTEEGGTFKKDPGKILSLYTNGRIWTLSPESALRLKIELSYVKLYHYNKNVIRNDILYNVMNYDRRDIYLDEKIRYGSIEAGIMPEYYREINNDSAYDIFFGPAIGIGGRSYESRHARTGAFYYDHESVYYEGPSFDFPVNLNLGFSYYYKFFVFELRYRFTHICFEYGEDFGMIFTQIGVAF